MTVKEFISKLEEVATEKGVINENILSIGTGCSLKSSFYSITTENMPFNDTGERIETRLMITYQEF